MLAPTLTVPGFAHTKRLIGIGLILCSSLMAVAAIRRLHEIALVMVILGAVIGLAVWRARYGLYAVAILVGLTEAQGNDPIMLYGWVMQSGFSSWSPFGFIPFSPLELILITTLVAVLVGSFIERRPIKTAQLWWPLTGYLVLLFATFASGIFRRGDLNIALWEVRQPVVMVLTAYLVANVFHTREQASHAINLIAIGAVVMSVDLIWRRYTILAGEERLELAYAHETPIYLNFAVVLFLARLIWPASGGQRLMVLFIPLLLYAAMVTERRAGWIGLDVCLIVLAIFMFRLRRKTFWFLVVPAAILYSGFIAATWSAEGPIAQPARAVRSINSPDARDKASNDYRAIEALNVRLNIQQQPITGLGFGRRYAFYYAMPDVSWWIFWPYLPHNSILWLWLKGGALLFTMFLVVIGAGIVRGVQLLKEASQDRSAPVLATSVGALLMLVTYCYVDLGMQNVRVAVLFGLVLGIIGAWGKDVAVRDNARLLEAA